MTQRFPVDNGVATLFAFVDANRTDGSDAPYSLIMQRPLLVLTREGDGSKTFQEAGKCPPPVSPNT